MASSSSSSSWTTTFVYTVAAVAVGRITWNNIPGWIKNAVRGSMKGITGSNENANGDDETFNVLDANDELATPFVVWSKIKEVMTLANELSEDVRNTEMPQYKLMACFMSFIHSMMEIDAYDPEFRETYFREEGTDVDVEELQILTKYLDLAEWAYLESQIGVEKLLQPLGYKLVRFDNATEPGRVGHFIAVHHDKKEVVISIKGTSTLSDVLTDIIGKAIPHTMEGDKEIRCHEGMYTAALYLLEETLHLIEKFFAPQGYSLIICGHSLGAGVSCLLGMFINQHSMSKNLNLHVYAFATPACCSYEASLDCQYYITSIVNNTDCVPRLSLMNLRLLYKMMALMEEKLDEKGLSPDTFAKARRYLSDLMTIDSKLLITPDEVKSFLETELGRPREDRFIDMELYVPGRVISIWNHVSDADVIGGRVTNGQSQVLKQIFVEPTMVSDHACDSYRTNLMNLLEQTANTI